LESWVASESQLFFTVRFRRQRFQQIRGPHSSSYDVSMDHIAILTVLVFLAAVLYSSVGHAGASAYLAAMALMSVPTATMRPTSLVLNILVATIGTIRYANAGCFSWKVFWPFAAASIPFSFVGGMIHLPGNVYKQAVGIVLLFAAVRLFTSTRKQREAAPKPAPVLAALLAGAAIGLLAGLTATGGGIFLSPLLILAGWASTRECAGVSAAFVLVNSLGGLAGNPTSIQALPPTTIYLLAAAGAGGVIGSELGSRRLAPNAMRKVLAVVLVIAGGKLILQPEKPSEARPGPVEVKATPDPNIAPLKFFDAADRTKAPATSP